MAEIRRRNSVTCMIGKVRVGSDAPLVVQSMTNTDTADVLGTVKQVEALARAGSEMVRVTVNNDDAAKAVPQIVDLLYRRGIDVPVIGDFHYNGHLLLKKYPECARALAKYRINPGQRERRPQRRRQLPHHGRSCCRKSETGPHRRELGIARPTTAYAHDGRKLPLCRAERRSRRDHGSHGGQRIELRQTGGKIRTTSRSDHPQRKSQRRAGSRRRLSEHGSAL